MEEFDVVIIGSGVAGMTAAIYTSRLGLKTQVIENLIPGGQIINVEKIEDFPGFPQGISGAELTDLMKTQAQINGSEFVMSEISKISKKEDIWTIQSSESKVMTKTIIIAAGSTLSKLNVPGEKELVGGGVSYCATCDGAFFIDQKVCVIGGGDSALQEALSLSEFAKEIYILCNKSSLHAQKILQDRVESDKKISIKFNVQISEIHGDGMVEHISILNLSNNETTKIKMDGVFIFVGLNPNSQNFNDLVNTDQSGHIITDENLNTNQPGIFAAGDIRNKSFSQLITSSSDGAMAAISAYRHIAKMQK
tara:strand:- start:92 stop:1015 length:924 start_codon:yes stop_codon:yes gene_type:complete